MSLKKLLHDFLISEGKVELIKEYGNFLDGDGTVEICDWVGDTDIRIIFRSNY